MNHAKSRAPGGQEPEWEPPQKNRLPWAFGLILSCWTFCPPGSLLCGRLAWAWGGGLGLLLGWREWRSGFVCWTLPMTHTEPLEELFQPCGSGLWSGLYQNSCNAQAQASGKIGWHLGASDFVFRFAQMSHIFLMSLISLNQGWNKVCILYWLLFFLMFL